MLESLAEDLAAHRGSPDKVPARRLATLEFAGELAIPFTTGILVGIGDTRSDQLAALHAIAAATPATGTSRRSSSRTSCPSRARPCPGRALPARGPAVGDCGGPPDAAARDPRAGAAEPLRRPGPAAPRRHRRLGGVSPSRPTTSTPSEPGPRWTSARVTEAAGHTLAPRLTVYPNFALDPARWLDPALRFAVMDASDAEGLAHDTSWCSGGEAPPPPLLGGRRRGRATGTSGGGSAVAEVLAGVALGQEVGEAEIVTLFAYRRGRGAPGGRGG